MLRRASVKAREARDAAKAELRAGRDPARPRAPDATALLTFEAAARAWHALQKPTWTERHAADVLASLEQDVFPELGACQLAAITPPDVLRVLRAIEARPAIETARRVRQRMSAVFVHAIASGEAEADPAAIVRGALAPLKKGRQPAIVELDEARAVLRATETLPAYPVTKLALRFLALTAVRAGELRRIAWCEPEGLDGDTPTWRVPGPRMKMKREPLVPLVRQRAEVLDTVRKLTGRAPLVFPKRATRTARCRRTPSAIG